MEAPGAYRVRRFSTIDLVRTAEDVQRGTIARSTVHLSKHLAALMDGRPLLAYDASDELAAGAARRRPARRSTAGRP